jgi:periplasmic divalent cation tolerance protein
MTVVMVVLCTAPSGEAERLARELVEARLAACVNLLGPVRSVYRWQGKVESGDETLLVIKTTRETFAALRNGIRARHSYECPEILALPVESGLGAYLDWVAGAVGEEREG